MDMLGVLFVPRLGCERCSQRIGRQTGDVSPWRSCKSCVSLGHWLGSRGTGIPCLQAREDVKSLCKHLLLMHDRSAVFWSSRTVRMGAENDYRDQRTPVQFQNPNRTDCVTSVRTIRRALCRTVQDAVARSDRGSAASRCCGWHQSA